MTVRGVDLFNCLASLALPAGTYAVFGSGPLAVRGIVEEPGDLDVLVTDDTWRLLTQRWDPVHVADFSIDLVEIDCELAGGRRRTMSFGREWRIGEVDVAQLIATAEVIDGLPFVTVDHVIAYKRIMGRPKDHEHLRLAAEAGFA